MDWQPISTAPRDGTKIIVFRPVFDGTYIPEVGVDWFGVYCGRRCWAKSREDTQPTMWQPMPQPPRRKS